MNTTATVPTVLNSFLKHLEQGNVPWSLQSDEPFRPLVLPLRHDSKPFGLLNSLLIWSRAGLRYDSPHFLTEHQGSSMRGTLQNPDDVISVLVWKRPSATQHYDCESYGVYNAQLFEGINARQFRTPPWKPADRTSVAANQLIAKTQAIIILGDNTRTYFQSQTEIIRVPDSSHFPNDDHYLCTVLTMLMYWCGHTSRLNWSPVTEPMHADLAALTASLGAAYLASYFQLPYHLMAEHKPLIARWSHQLQEDPTRLIRAVRRAQHAIDLLLELPDRTSSSATSAPGSARAGSPGSKRAVS